ncbi:HD domain-containing phosphohydrolase [Leptospira jelokensis]|uniref:HD domain-containing phosphohydrolase n=1 Tax=Leptospira jelokensis TaxID=2484931 RepID=UPI001091776D|nr:HD domain-containing phosphohydrolase [Leptospira jelokensis]TGM01676.1 HD domain-containing protein [Leptospira jelokensis]
MLDIKEILISISIALDYANGRKPEFTLKLALVSVFLAKLTNCNQREIHFVYLASLFKSIGCTSYSSEEAEIFSGDDISFKSLFSTVDSMNRVQALIQINQLRAESRWDDLKMKLRLILDGNKIYKNIIEAHCDSAKMLIQEIQLDPEISAIINDSYERYDGKGTPNQKKANEIHFLSRILSLSYYFVSLSEIMDSKTIRKRLVKSKASMFDPNLVDSLLQFLDELLIMIQSDSIHDDALFVSPNIYVSHLQSVAKMISYLPDFKSKYTSLHSKKVSELAVYLAKKLKLSEVEQNKVYISALLMNIGMVCIPSGILEKKGNLNRSERERIETHTFFTDQILRKSKLLTPYIEYCISHHENSKGTGYHRRVKELSIAQSILIYADKVVALASERSYRNAFSNEDILSIVKNEVREGYLDKNIFPFVEEYLGFKKKKIERKENKYSLTEREIQVLELIAEGNTNKQIGLILKLSARTVQHHTIHIYEKMGVKTRSAAVMIGYKEKILQI